MTYRKWATASFVAATLLSFELLSTGCTPRPVETISSPEVTSVIPKVTDKKGRWVLIDTQRRTLIVFDNNTTVDSFSHLARGTNGVGSKKRRGDNITPVGLFKVGWITRNTRFKIFIGLNYPTVEYAEKGFASKLIDEKTLTRIRLAVQKGEVPPQNTALGGYIGIHGIGRGSLKIHHLIDWTDGCIALDNQQIEKLGRLVKIGMNVEIE